MKILKVLYGKINNKQIFEYTLINKYGIKVSLINLGATITKIITKDKHGHFSDIVLGFNNLEGYLQKENRYFGATIGRYANRILNSTFTIEDKKYNVNKNCKNNSLHGGIIGFDKVIWDVLTNEKSNSITFSYLSPNGEEGYPGNLNIKVIYTLKNTGSLVIQYVAFTDRATPVNITNHTYFNLSSDFSDGISDHLLKINSSKYLDINKDLIPTGKIKNVNKTIMDFRKERVIHQSFKNMNYDNTWLLNGINSKINKAATLKFKKNGKKLDVYTTLPSVQFYDGNKIDSNALYTKGCDVYKKYYGICIEPQFFPNSINCKIFPNTILIPGKKYDHFIIYKFSITK